MTWTDEIVERMKVLWAEGLSASRVADILNGEFATSYTRNSVIGKIHRLDIERNYHASPKARIYRKRNSFEPKLLPLPKAKEPVSMPRNIPMLARKDSECPFPMWAHEATPGLDPIVCGAEKDLCEPYCTGHMKLTHNAKQPRTASTIALREGFKRPGPARSAIIDFTFVDGEAA